MDTLSDRFNRLQNVTPFISVATEVRTNADVSTLYSPYASQIGALARPRLHSPVVLFSQ